MGKLVPVCQIPQSCHNQWSCPFVSRHSHTVHLHQYQDTWPGRPKINRDWTQSGSCINSPTQRFVVVEQNQGKGLTSDPTNIWAINTAICTAVGNQGYRWVWINNLHVTTSHHHIVYKSRGWDSSNKSKTFCCGQIQCICIAYALFHI